LKEERRSQKQKVGYKKKIEGGEWGFGTLWRTLCGAHTVREYLPEEVGLDDNGTFDDAGKRKVQFALEHVHLLLSFLFMKFEWLLSSSASSVVRYDHV
jgi:hypothetical protein